MADDSGSGHETPSVENQSSPSSRSDTLDSTRTLTAKLATGRVSSTISRPMSMRGALTQSSPAAPRRTSQPRGPPAAAKSHRSSALLVRHDRETQAATYVPFNPQQISESAANTDRIFNTQQTSERAADTDRIFNPQQTTADT
jgi:hypothetical protein